MVTRKEWLRAGDLAALLGVSRSRVYQLIAEGELPAVRQGRSVRVPRAAWEAWLEEQRVMAMAAAPRVRRRENQRDRTD
jgi:excisionase family DNA binding protein